MMRGLKPFWIYWGALIILCILFFIWPLLFFVFLPVLLIIVSIGIGIVYMVGNAVQLRSGSDKIVKRIVLSAICTFLTVMIFPVCSWVYDAVRWNDLQLDSFANNFRDRTFWIAAFVHFLTFWIGEETGRIRDREVLNSEQEGDSYEL